MRVCRFPLASVCRFDVSKLVTDVEPVQGDSLCLFVNVTEKLGRKTRSCSNIWVLRG